MTDSQEIQPKTLQEALHKYKYLLHLYAHKHIKYKGLGFEKEDLIQIGAIGLIRAYRTYDPTKNAKFATYASMLINGAIIDAVRPYLGQYKSHVSKIRFEKKINFDTEIASDLPTPLDEAIKSQSKESINVWLKDLTKQQRQVVECMYFKGLTQAETSIALNRDFSRISQIHKEIILKLRKRQEEFKHLDE